MTRRLSVVLLVAVALTVPSPIRADDDVSALLAKHKAYVGWEFGDGTFKTMRVETTLARVGKDGKAEELARAIDLQRGVVNHLTRITSSSGSRADSGFTGSIYWLSDQNGFTIPRLDDGRKTTVGLTVLFGEGSTTLPATLVRRETVAGTPTVVLRERIPNAVPLDLYIDPASGAYKRAVVDPDGTPTQVEIEGYGEIAPGKRAITAYHYAGETVHRNRVITPNVTISDAELHPPVPRAAWTFGSGQPFYFDFAEKRMYVDATVNGVKGRFTLDTGSYSIAFTAAFASRANLKALPGQVRVSGVSGEMVHHLAQVDAITFGDGSTLHNTIVTTGLSNGMDSDGLMGFDFLAGAIVELDLDKNRMTLYDPKASAPSDTGGAIVIPDLSTLIPQVPAKLNGSIPTYGLLDSGNPVYVLLSTSMQGKTRTLIDRSRLGAELLISGISNQAVYAECGQLGSIDIGALRYAHVPACFTDGWPEGSALLGLDFIRNFNLVIDYPDDKIVLFPRKKYQ
jgi:predicted aspartyl protease